jgi:hypothetical protein
MLALLIVAIVLASLSFIGVLSIWIYLVQVRKRFLIQARDLVNQRGQGQRSQVAGAKPHSGRSAAPNREAAPANTKIAKTG